MLHRAHRARVVVSKGAALCVSCLFVVGCASAPRPRIVYPPPPEKERIVWVRSFTSQPELQTGVFRRILRALVSYDTSSTIYAPTALALSPDERRLYVALPHRSRVIVVDLTSGSMSSIGIDGGAPLKAPVGVAVDAEGNVFVSDKDASVVHVYDRKGRLLRAFGGETLSGPTTVAMDRRRQVLYVLNGATKKDRRHTVEVFSLAGKHLRSIGGERSAEPGGFNFPKGIAVSPSGQLHVGDTLNFRVQVLDEQGLQRMFGEPGTGVPGAFDKIHGIAFDAFGNEYVADAVQGIHVFNDRGQPLMMFGQGVAQAPTAIAIDSKNRIFVADLAHRVHEFVLVNTAARDSYEEPARPAAQGAKSP